MKFDVQQKAGVRKQLLVVGDEVLIGFIQMGKKFADCETLTEVTENVDCKVNV